LKSRGAANGLLLFSFALGGFAGIGPGILGDEEKSGRASSRNEKAGIADAEGCGDGERPDD
jgi:hypothetical protein